MYIIDLIYMHNSKVKKIPPLIKILRSYLMVFLPAFILLSLLLSHSLFAQEIESNVISKPKLIKEDAVVLVDTSENKFSTFEFPTFKQVHKQGIYRNNESLVRIEALKENLTQVKDSNEWQRFVLLLDRELRNYIAQFRMDNFRRDSSLLWTAGQIKHMLGDTAQALLYYELAIKHNNGMAGPRDNYDSLKAPIHNEWLPLDKYYELLEIRKKIDTLVKPHKVFVSLGPRVNSIHPDYAPYMHKTDSVLIFTSRREKEDLINPFVRDNEDLYYSYKDIATGDWEVAEKMPSNINTQYNEGSACLGPDGKVLYFTRCNDPQGLGDCDLYRAEYEPANNRWKNLKNLGENVNSSYWDSQPHISIDGKYLFFSSNRSGGLGGTDIYYCRKKSDGDWGPAINAGPMINSDKEEVTPFMHAINQTLYYSSTGQLTSLGGFDIFRSRKMGQYWEPPKNLGPLVNTKGNEYYFSIDAEATTIFYARSDDNDEHVKQNFDLYSFPMPMEARPNATSTIKGVLIDSVSGYPLVGTVMVIDLEEGIEIAPKEINDEGYFEFDLINNRRYRIYVMGNNFLTIKSDLVLDNDTSFQMLTRSFEQNKPIVFESFEFGSNRYKLKTRIKPKLDYIVKFLELYPMFNLQVEGHTDSDGGAEYNLKLSEQRAKMIATYITRQGSFDTSRISSKGLGETRPVVPNISEENKRKNRRVEFKLTIRPEFKGDMWLPTKDELYYKKELEKLDEWYEEQTEEIINNSDDEFFEEEFDLEKELEKDIIDSKLTKDKP